MKPMISDHALIRWLERAHGMNMEFFRKKLAEEAGPIGAVGDLVLRRGDLRFVVQNGTLVTVLDKQERVDRKLHRWMRGQQ